jgi:PsbP-like protein
MNFRSVRLSPIVLLLAATAAMAQNTGAPVKADDLKSKEVIFGTFKKYVPPDQSFSIDLPENWKIDDGSTASETIIKSSDPNVNAALVVHVWKQNGELPGGATQFLKDFLKDTVSTLSNYTQGEPKVQKDGSVGIYFKYDQTVKSGTFNMWGDAFIQREGDMVGMLFFIIPHEQYQLKMTSAYKLINSFKLGPGVK